MFVLGICLTDLLEAQKSLQHTVYKFVLDVNSFVREHRHAESVDVL
jgi:hypothetical protein